MRGEQGRCAFLGASEVVLRKCHFMDQPKLLMRSPGSLDGPNRQSPIASVQRTRSTLAGHSADPRETNTTPTNANRAIRIAIQRTQGLRGPHSVFWGGGDMTANER